MKIFEIERYCNNQALLDEHGDSVTYGKLGADIDLIASFVESRCLIFCLCRNEIGSVLGYVSFLNNRIVPVLLSSNTDPELLNNLISTYKPDYIWVPHDTVELFDYESIYEAYDYCLLKTGYDHVYPLNDELALLLTTSGSTGSPKFVRQSYTNIRSNAESIAEYLRLDSSERPITTLPMNYTYGLSIINSHLLVGATILLTDKGLMQKEFWTFFKDQGATSFGGVPYTYEMLDKLRFYRMDLPTLRTMTQAGGKLTVELHEKFAKYAQEKNKNFIVMYGQCEATARMGYLPSDKSLEKIGSMGVAIPGGKFHLIDTDGRNIDTPFTTGELVYEGPNVTMGYAECGVDLIKGDERDGILETGDMAQFDEDGYYYIVGRKKRFLKIYGNRVNLDEVDRLIKGRFGIDVACAGIDDHMYIFITDEAFSSDVKDYVTFTTKLNPAAFKTIAIDEIPKNDAGKTLYRELEKYYAD